MGRASKFVWLAALLALVACARTSHAGPSIKSDEEVVLFDAIAFVHGDEWRVPLRAWVFEPEDGSRRRALVRRALKKKYGLSPTKETQATFEQRVNWFLVDNERGKVVTVELGGKTYDMPPTQSNGHTWLEVALPRAAIEVGETRPIRVRLKGRPTVEAQVHFPEPSGITVISDIDDTVKISDVLDHQKLMERTFFQAFEAAPGMAATYTRWAKSGTRVHFVSSSPWQLYVPLRSFLEQSGFPAFDLHLKSVHLTDETVLDLFAPGTETKPLQIEPIFAAHGDDAFVLVGDSGEHDPEVYGALYRKYPERVRAIYIRNVNEATRDDARWKAAFEGVPPETWSLFTDPADLPLPGAPRLPTPD